MASASTAARASGRKSHCKACDRKRAASYYDAHKDEMSAQREAVREAARLPHLAALAVTHEKKVAAAKKEAEAGARRQRELLASLGVPDLSPEGITRGRLRKGGGRTAGPRPLDPRFSR